MTAVDAALRRLESSNFFYEYDTEDSFIEAEVNSELMSRAQNESKRLRRLFVAYPNSVQLFQRFHNVILLDNTYKTNKYGKPVLNICGSNQTIQITLTFLVGESEPEYC